MSAALDRAGRAADRVGGIGRVRHSNPDPVDLGRAGRGVVVVRAEAMPKFAELISAAVQVVPQRSVVVPYALTSSLVEARPVAARIGVVGSDRAPCRLHQEEVLEVDRAGAARAALDLDLDAEDLCHGRDREAEAPRLEPRLWLLPATEMLARVLSLA